MLEPIFHSLSSKRIVLASSSPRRKEIFSQSCPKLNIEIIPSLAEENLDVTEYKDKPWAFAEETALLKAKEVFQRLLASKDDTRYIKVFLSCARTFRHLTTVSQFTRMPKLSD
jgi:septum formation protein